MTECIVSLTTTTPASALQLLTIAQIREPAGEKGSCDDVKLTALGLRIAAECNIAGVAVGPPTLRCKTLTKTIRPSQSKNCRWLTSMRPKSPASGTKT